MFQIDTFNLNKKTPIQYLIGEGDYSSGSDVTDSSSEDNKDKGSSNTNDSENDLSTAVSSVWSFARGTVGEVASLFSNWRYSLAFAANQAGSFTFVVALVNSDISLAVPVANGLKFVFSLAVGRWLGEEGLGVRQQLGLALVLVGTVAHYLS